MIKFDALTLVKDRIPYSGTLQELQTAVQTIAQNMGVPVSIETDQVKSGGLFNSTVEDCLVLYNPQHPRDYYRCCVRIVRQGNYSFASIGQFGESKLTKKDAIANVTRKNNPGVMSNLLFRGANKKKVEEEEMYYDMLIDVLFQALGA